MRYSTLVEYIDVNPEKFQARTSSDPSFNQYRTQIGDDFPKWLEQYDPTQNNKLVNWVITRYMKGDIKSLSDIPTKITKYLDDYSRLARTKKLKPEHKDINKIKDLEPVVKSYIGSDGQGAAPKSKKEKKKSVEQSMYDEGDAELVYNSGNYKIVIPKTHKASCYFGKNTKWCTTAEDDPNTHNKYAEKGNLYIILEKSTNSRWQFHFEFGQYMDEADDEIDHEEFVDEYPEVAKAFIDIGKVTVVEDGELYEFIGVLVDANGQIVRDLSKYVEKFPDRIAEMAYRVLDRQNLPIIPGSVRLKRGGLLTHNNVSYIILDYWDNINEFADDVSGGYSPRNSDNTTLKAALEYMEDISSYVDGEDIGMFKDQIPWRNFPEDVFEKTKSKIISDVENYDDDNLDDDVRDRMVDELSNATDIGDIFDVVHDYFYEEPYEELSRILSDCVRYGIESGVSSEVWNAINDTYENFSTEYGAELFFGEPTEEVSTSLRFDTKVHLALPLSSITIDEETREYIIDDGWLTDEFASFGIEQPRYGFNGFDEEVALQHAIEELS